KDPGSMCSRDPRAGVTYTKDDGFAPVLDADGNGRGFSCIFYRIVDEICQNVIKRATVGTHKGGPLSVHLQSCLKASGSFAEQAQDLTNEGFRLDWLKVNAVLARLHSGEIEQVLNQHLKTLCVALHYRNKTKGHLGLSLHRRLERLTRGSNTRHWRAQFMGHVRHKLATHVFKTTGLRHISKNSENTALSTTQSHDSYQQLEGFQAGELYFSLNRLRVFIQLKGFNEFFILNNPLQRSALHFAG